MYQKRWFRIGFGLIEIYERWWCKFLSQRGGCMYKSRAKLGYTGNKYFSPKIGWLPGEIFPGQISAPQCSFLMSWYTKVGISTAFAHDHNHNSSPQILTSQTPINITYKKIDTNQENFPNATNTYVKVQK